MRRTIFANIALPELAGTAVATCFVTYMLVVPAVWIGDIGSAPHAFGLEALASALASLGGLTAGAVFAVPLGFVGAFAFLALSIGQIDRRRPLRRFMLVGASAGLAHCLCGLALRLLLAADAVPGPVQLASGALVFLGGFALTNLSRTMLIAAFAAAPIAGAAAGWLYAGLLRLKPGASADV